MIERSLCGLRGHLVRSVSLDVMWMLLKRSCKSSRRSFSSQPTTRVQGFSFGKTFRIRTSTNYVWTDFKHRIPQTRDLGFTHSHQGSVGMQGQSQANLTDSAQSTDGPQRLLFAPSIPDTRQIVSSSAHTRGLSTSLYAGRIRSLSRRRRYP